MNKRLQIFARWFLKKTILQCTSGQQDVFKRMYGYNETDLFKIIDNMPEEKLNRAMEQVERTLEKRGITCLVSFQERFTTNQQLNSLSKDTCMKILTQNGS